MASSISSPSLGAGASSALSSFKQSKDMGKTDFLNLMVTQLKAQNPLQPTNNTEFASQLAQFTQLETLQNMQKALENQTQANLSLTQSITNSSAAGLIGKTVRAQTSQILTDGETPIKLGYNLDRSAANVSAEIHDSSGNVIQTFSISNDMKLNGDHTFTWNGKNRDGLQVAPGKYKLVVKAEDGNSESINSTPLVFGKVSSIRYKSDGSYLVVGSAEINLSDVTEVSESPTA